MISKEAERVADKFMGLIKDGSLEKETRQNNGPERDKEYVTSQVEEYHKILKTGIVSDFMKL